jgi:DNA-directed RNA polymerase specialized sigma24 family protein
VTTSAELFGALTRLRDAARGAQPRDLAAERVDWRRVEVFVRRSRAAEGQDCDDVVQEALLAIARHVGDLDARDEGASVAWCARIVRHKKIDLSRARAREGQRVETRQDEPTAVDLLEGDDGRAIDDRALSILLEVVDEAIVKHVDGLGIRSAAERQLKRSQARATLHRVMGTDTAELRSVLALEPSFGADRLAKWIERGRPILVAVLDRLAWDHEGDAKDVVLALREAVLARRVDAGVARPDRRKRNDDGVP